MQKKTVPFFGSLIDRDPSSTSLKDQRFVNCYPEVVQNAISQAGTVFCNKRSGFTNTGAGPGGSVGSMAALVWSGSSTRKLVTSYFNSSTNNFYVYDTGGTIVGAAIAGIYSGGVLGGGFSPCSKLSETLISGDPYLVLVAKRNSDGFPDIWYIKEGSAGWTNVVGANFPQNQPTKLTIAGNVVHSDGYMFMMDTRGNIWNTDLNAFTVTNSNQFINAQVYPDGGCGLARTKNLIVAFGTRSIEFFQNAGNATGSPLARVANATISIGARPAWGTNFDDRGWENIKEIDDEIYYVGVSGSGANLGIYKLSGTVNTKISTPEIDKLLNAFPSSYGIGGPMFFNGTKHILIRMAAGFSPFFSLMYSVENGSWWYLQLGSGTNICTPVSSTAQITYFTSTDNNFLYSTSTYADFGSPFEMLIQTESSNYNDNGYGVQFKALEVVADHQSTAGNMTISSSDDDYATFQTLGTIDTSSGTQRITRLGSTRRDYNNKRAWKFSESVDRPFRGTGFVVWFDNRVS